MTRFALWRKIIAITLANFLFVQLFAGTAYALGEGPAQPEATQFEPVDTTDLVNLSTGDFVYNLPLMEVPGPEAGYPISLSYHSGVSTNQEATWVGLGWSLNPGAINRTVAGYPDDYKGDKVETHYWAKTKRGWGAQIALGWGPVGMSMNFDNHGGFGANATLGQQLTPFVDAGLSAGTNGISANVGASQKITPFAGGSIGLSAGTQGISAHMGIGAQSKGGWAATSSSVSFGTNGVRFSQSISGLRGLAGFGLSSGGGGANYSIGGIGISSMSMSNGGKVSMAGLTILIPLPGDFWASLGFSVWKWRLNETFVEDGYGYIHQAFYHADEDDEDSKKFERHVQDKYLYSSQDFYSIAAQGANGSFMPFAKDPYMLWDGHKSENKAQLKKEYTAYSELPSNVVEIPTPIK